MNLGLAVGFSAAASRTCSTRALHFYIWAQNLPNCMIGNVVVVIVAVPNSPRNGGFHMCAAGKLCLSGWLGEIYKKKIKNKKKRS